MFSIIAILCIARLALDLGFETAGSLKRPALALASIPS